MSRLSTNPCFSRPMAFTCLKYLQSFSVCLKGITIPTTQGSPMVVQQGLKITEELVQRVEVVYVLGLFLLGKHRKKVSLVYFPSWAQSLKVF